MPATPPLTADFLPSPSPRRRHHKSRTNFQPLKEGLLNAKYGIGAGVFQLSAVSTWRNDGSEEFHFCLFFPSACHQRLFFFLSRRLLIFGAFSCPLTSSLSVRSLSSGCCRRGRSRRGEGGRFLPYTRLQTVHLGSDGRTRSALTWARVRFQTARPPVFQRRRRGSGDEKPGRPPRMGN